MSSLILRSANCYLAAHGLGGQLTFCFAQRKATEGVPYGSHSRRPATLGLGHGWPMYKLLLSWRYLRTRYIALASIISVTLGVGTLIVVNSVMAGFAHEMHVRLKGILSDIIIESHSIDGLVNPAWHMDEIRKVVGDDLVGTTAAVHVPAMLNIKVYD